MNNMIEIKSNIRNYSVEFKKDLSFINELLKIKNSVFVVDKNVYNLYNEYFKHANNKNTIILEATEENKTIETALEICEKITELPSKRNTNLISIGGGIIQDITGFVANIVYRGINWIFVPTTLLAACDSCIGGKTSLNYKKYKNLLGTFFPPTQIKVCSEFFKTLTVKDFYSGLGEVIKFNIMKGKNGLEQLNNDIEKVLCRDNEIINYYTKTSLEFKKKFIEEDEFDRGERIKLNFAHTFGHAIEVISKYVIPHGTAVAIGMIMANSISKKRNILNNNITIQSEQLLLKVIDIDKELLSVDIEEYINAIKKDKKQLDEHMTAVLLADNNEKMDLLLIHDLTKDEVKYALNYFLELYR